MTSVAARLGAGVLATLLLAVGWFGGLHESGNYHQVIAGELYRSGQLSGPELTRRIHQDGIRSVINLRGSQTDSGWYDDELAASDAAGVAHFNVRISSAQHLDMAQARDLLAVMQAAPKPVLVHCAGGADRSGLAAALYLAATGHPLDEAARQLSARFGFVGIEGVTRPWPMWESWLRLGPAVAKGAVKSGGERGHGGALIAEGTAAEPPSLAPSGG